MADEAQDVNQQVGTQDTTATESSAAENNAPEVAESSTSKLWDDQNEETTDPKPETDKPETTPGEQVEQQEETTEEEQPRGKDANSRIRTLVAEKNKWKDKFVQLSNQVYRPQSIDELVEEGMSETDAKVAALEQKLEIRDYNDRVADSQFVLNEDSSRVLQDFPMFNPDSDKFDEEIAIQVAPLLEANLIRDPNIPEIDPQTGQRTGKGVVIGAHVSPYQLYKPIADAYQKSRIEGQVAGQKSAEQMSARVSPQSSGSQSQPAKSSLLELWDK
jgi:hypothetical protein